MPRIQKLQQADAWVWFVWTLLIEGLDLYGYCAKGYIFHWEKSLGLPDNEIILYG